MADKKLQKLTEKLSRECTDSMLQLPGMLLDEIVYTIQYSITAQVIDSRYSQDNNFMNRRYGANRELLESDSTVAPLMLERLERLSQETPEGSVMQQFAQKHLPHISRFGEILREYNKKIKDN